MLLAGVLLFAHGCHGEDHDDELGIGFFDQMRPRPAQRSLDKTIGARSVSEGKRSLADASGSDGP
jgi:hypothetical protein